jgi:hypothetical protein
MNLVNGIIFVIPTTPCIVGGVKSLHFWVKEISYVTGPDNLCTLGYILQAVLVPS